MEQSTTYLHVNVHTRLTHHQSINQSIKSNQFPSLINHPRDSNILLSTERLYTRSTIALSSRTQSVNSAFLYIDLMQTDSRVKNFLPTFFVDRKGIFVRCSTARCAIIQLAYTWHIGNRSVDEYMANPWIVCVKLGSEVCTG